MGGVANSAKNFVKSPTRVLTALGTSGASEAWRKTMPGVSQAQQLSDNWLSGNGQNSSIPGPFYLDPEQLAQDKASILGLGEKQYSDTLAGIDQYDSAQTKRANELFTQMLPNIAENSQAAHLYDSTGYGQEVARQQSDIASRIAADSAQQRLSALNGRQGFETGALQRGLSMEDFINQANVAKTIGAQMAPQPASGKQNFGTVAQGVGALSPWAKIGKGAATGGAPGAAAGAAATVLPAIAGWGA